MERSPYPDAFSKAPGHCHKPPLGASRAPLATVIEMHENDRLTVLMELLSRAVRVRVDERQISPV